MAGSARGAQVIETGGGTYDAEDRPIYFAAVAAHLAGPNIADDVYPPRILLAVNELMDSTDVLDRNLDRGRTVLLDSGIFWLTQEHMKRHPGMTMDVALGLAPTEIDGFTELWARYLELVKRYESRLWGYVELDQGGAANKRITRLKLHEEGLRPIPVYHPVNDGFDYFDELAGQYDRMCVGNLVQAHRSFRLRLLALIWERHRLYPQLWIHGLGLTASELMHAYPLDSIDSSSWTGALRWHMQKVITADLQTWASHPPDARYRLGDSDSIRAATLLATWNPLQMNHNWRSHRRELDALGLEAYPPISEGEEHGQTDGR